MKVRISAAHTEAESPHPDPDSSRNCFDSNSAFLSDTIHPQLSVCLVVCLGLHDQPSVREPLWGGSSFALPHFPYRI